MDKDTRENSVDEKVFEPDGRSEEPAVGVPEHSGTIPFESKPSLNRLAGAASLVISLVVYYFTTCPVIYFGDAGELTTAAWRGGVAHPPGYPSYIMALAAFLRLPLSWLAPNVEHVQPVAWQANFFSAVLGGLTVWIVYLIILRLIRLPLFALLGAVLVAFGRTFWSQTGIAEVYTLNAFFFALMMLLAVVQNEKAAGTLDRSRLFRWGSLVWGLALSNHHESAFLFPLWLSMLYLALQPGRETKRPALPHARTILEGIIFIFLGLLPYLYLPIAAAFKPVLNWGDPSTLDNFMAVLTREEYRAVKVNITGNLVTSMEILLNFLYWSAIQYTPVLLILLVPGARVIMRPSPHRTALAGATISVLLMCATFIVYFAGIDRPSMFFLEVYFIPWYILLGILITCSIPTLVQAGNFPEKYQRHTRRILAVTAIVLLLVIFVVQRVNLEQSDMSDNIAGYVYSHDVLATLPNVPQENVLITGGDEIFLFWYWKWVEETEKDVAVIGTDALGSSTSWFWDDLKRDKPGLVMPCDFELSQRYSGTDLKNAMLEKLLRENRDTHRVWMTAWDPEFDPIIHEGPWHMVLDGPILELEWDTESVMTDYPRASVPADQYLFTALLEVNRSGLAPFEEEIYDRYAAACYNLASYFDWNNEPEAAVEFAGLCLRFRPRYTAGPRLPTPVSILVSNIYETGDLELAEDVLTDLLEQDPDNSLYHSAMAELYLANGDLVSALGELDTAIRLDPDNEFIRAMRDDLTRQMDSNRGTTD